MKHSMHLAALLADIVDTGAAADCLISGLNLDSRSIVAGEAFVALRGSRTHGIRFADAAAARGAAVVLAEGEAATSETAALENASLDIPVIWIADLRARLGELAARFFGEPAEALQVIGVTGTNGKTSTVQLLAQALNSLQQRCATIGTLGAGFDGVLQAAERTTPDVISVQRTLADFRERGASHVAMEVSSHALQQGRVDAVRIRVGVFTNLSRDHLDYHATMQEYGAAKQRLFQRPELEVAVVNLDDTFGRQILAELPSGLRRISYSMQDASADVHASAIETTADGLGFVLHTKAGSAEVRSHLLGRFNVANLLAVAACLLALECAPASIASTLAKLDPVAGRMSRLGGGEFPLLVIDYAHTPDALEQTLHSLRAHCSGLLYCVFGCGGERDAGKRAAMGAIAERLSDRVIVTDDNPRGEDGDAIVTAIVSGFHDAARAEIVRDRAAAIARAVNAARAGDVVLIAGKGHEATQEVAGRKLPFDDLHVARAALEARAC